jgi:serine/threonine protein phosphatase PrpC
MRVSERAYYLPKAGNIQDEYEDAYWPKTLPSNEADSFSFGIADGATETSFSGEWAQILVQAYCERKISYRKKFKTLPELQKDWLLKVGQKLLPWYAEEKIKSGAFSSFLGLTTGLSHLE